jgi:ribosomal protein L29
MKLNKIVEKNDKELEALIAESRAKAAEIAINLRTTKVANIKELHEVKRTIARAMTVKRQRELAATDASMEKNNG